MMFRKVVVGAVAVCALAGSAFATWDYFPPKDAGNGQARLNFEYAMPAEKTSTMALAVKGRYSIIEGLEAALSLPIPLSSSDDGTSAEDYVGLSIPEIGVRYWLPMGLGFYLDFALPVDTRYKKPDENALISLYPYEPKMSLAVGAQYSTNFTEELSLGSQLGITVPFAGSDSKQADGMGLVVGAEVDYAIGACTPFLGVELGMGLTKPTFDGDEVPGSDPADLTADLWIGAAYSINDMFGVDLSLKLGLTGYGDDNLPITIGFNFDFNF